MPETTMERTGRFATMQLKHGAEGQTLSVKHPGDISAEEFMHLNRNIYDLVHKLTGCNCMSGRIRVVVEDNFADVIRVDFNPAKVIGKTG